jgi:transcriptional regulator with XRE-family HTH domain
MPIIRNQSTLIVDLYGGMRYKRRHVIPPSKLTARPFGGTLHVTKSEHPHPNRRNRGLGAELRRLRISRHLSVRTLAGQLGFSPSFISQVERGQASPSIASLERIAETLGVGLRDLFTEPDARSAFFVKTEDRPAITSEWSKARIEALTLSHAPVPIDAILVHLLPGGASGKLLHSTPSHRFAFIWKGSVVLNVGQAEYVLKSGDAITLPAGVLHRWTNRSRRPVRIVVVWFRAS